MKKRLPPGLWHHMESEVSVQLHMCRDSDLAQRPSKTPLLISGWMWNIWNKFFTHLSLQEFAHFLCYRSHHKRMWPSSQSQRRGIMEQRMWRFPCFPFQHVVLITKAAAFHQVACSSWLGSLPCFSSGNCPGKIRWTQILSSYGADCEFWSFIAPAFIIRHYTGHGRKNGFVILSF